MDDAALLEVNRPVLLDQLVGPKLTHFIEQRQVFRIDRRIGRCRTVLHDLRGEQLVMAEEPNHFVVAGDDPQLEAFVPVHGIQRSEVSEIGIRVGDHLGGEQVIEMGGRHPCRFSLVVRVA